MVGTILNGGGTYYFGSSDDDVSTSDNAAYTIFTFEGGDTIDLSSNTSTTRVAVVFSGSNVTPTFRSDRPLSNGIASKDIITGSVGIEKVIDGSGDDEVNLMGGNDVAYVSCGDDLYDGGDGVDWLIFANQTNDGYNAFIKNFQAVTVDLAKTTVQNFGLEFGNDIVLNFENVDGSYGNDNIYGNALANRLLGNDGNDRLFGRAGNDSLFGELGADRMVGGAGVDKIHCGDGVGGLDNARDTIAYYALSESGITALTRDTIYYFDRGGFANDDKIDLSAIDANLSLGGNNAFVWRGAAAFTATAEGQVRIEDLGDHVIVHIDNDSDVGDEMTIAFYGVGTLTQLDFVL